MITWIKSERLSFVWCLPRGSLYWVFYRVDSKQHIKTSQNDESWEISLFVVFPYQHSASVISSQIVLLSFILFCRAKVLNRLFTGKLKNSFHFLVKRRTSLNDDQNWDCIAVKNQWYPHLKCKPGPIRVHSLFEIICIPLSLVLTVTVILDVRTDKGLIYDTGLFLNIPPVICLCLETRWFFSIVLVYFLEMTMHLCNPVCCAWSRGTTDACMCQMFPGNGLFGELSWDQSKTEGL